MMSALRVFDLTNVRLLALAQTLKADSIKESTVLRGKSLVYLPMLQEQHTLMNIKLHTQYKCIVESTIFLGQFSIS